MWNSRGFIRLDRRLSIHGTIVELREIVGDREERIAWSLTR